MRSVVFAVVLSLCMVSESGELPEDTSKLESLKVEQSKELAARADWRLDLGGLITINPAVARELANFKGNYLDLSGLTTIDKGTAEQIAKFKGRDLDLSGLTKIDESTAEQIAKFRGYLKLNGIQSDSFDLATAREIANFKGNKLHLCGLTTIKSDIAEQLAHYSGDLNLSGVTYIDKASAVRLAVGATGTINITGLREQIDKETATVLEENKSKFEYHRINNHFVAAGVTAEDLKGSIGRSIRGLVYLPYIDKEIAELARSCSTRGRLELRNLGSIDSESAHELSKFDGKCIDLRGVTTINAPTARELASFHGSFKHPSRRTPDKTSLRLGLTSIGADVARELAKYEGDLHLSGLTSIDKDALKALTSERTLESLPTFRCHKDDRGGSQLCAIPRSEFPEWFNSSYSDSCDLVFINSDFFHSFTRHGSRSSVALDGLCFITPSVAELLAKFEGPVSLQSLAEITPEVAEALAMHTGQLVLGLNSVTIQVADALAKHEGDLSLPNLTEITPDVAEALVKSSGGVSLNGLTSITPEVAKILQTNPKIEFPRSAD